MTKKTNESKPKSEKNQVQEQVATNDLATQKPTEDLKSEGTEEAPEPETSIENIDVQEESIEDAIASNGVTDESQDQLKKSIDLGQPGQPKEPIFHEESGPFPDFKELSGNAPITGKSWIETIDKEEEGFDDLEDLIEKNEDVVLPDSSEFKEPLPATERAHVDAVLKLVNESTAILRKKVILYQEFVATLPDSNEKEALVKKLSELHQ